MVVRNTGLDGSIAIRITEIINKKIKYFSSKCNNHFCDPSISQEKLQSAARKFISPEKDVYVMTKGYDNCIVHT